ncbi:damage-control phosphatase ARMT1 family protein [Desulfotruncus alcoholivorax]|uniref:damage-control phosphatase ARMT1 family protein n=1 Tax=Desulfotruncus alcoholivorax TaxID=265477 RepID=UPI0003F7C1B4|nr:ARMT1-like domain-containing protein [Desulfotruncus alcoholivorax]
MKASVDCVHCYLKQAVNCMSIAGVDEDRQYPVLFNIMDNIKTMDRQRTPAENSTEMLINLYQMINSNDPYQEIKKRLNTLGLDLYPGLKEYINKSGNKLYNALKIAASGNIIDLGINRDFDINASLEHSLSIGFSKDDYDRFIEKLGRVDQVVIVGDNAGEIVFDKLLVEELNQMGKKVAYIVKGGPILNDATMEDAVEVGMDKIAEVMTTGSNYLGVPLNKVAPEVVTLLANSDLVVSKGQANFESLEHEELARDRVFFLLKIKCPWVGKTAGANLGDVVFFAR